MTLSPNQIIIIITLAAGLMTLSQALIYNQILTQATFLAIGRLQSGAEHISPSEWNISSDELDAPFRFPRVLTGPSFNISIQYICYSQSSELVNP